MSGSFEGVRVDGSVGSVAETGRDLAEPVGDALGGAPEEAAAAGATVAAVDVVVGADGGLVEQEAAGATAAGADGDGGDGGAGGWVCGGHGWAPFG